MAALGGGNSRPDQPRPGAARRSPCRYAIWPVRAIRPPMTYKPPAPPPPLLTAKAKARNDIAPVGPLVPGSIPSRITFRGHAYRRILIRQIVCRRIAKLCLCSNFRKQLRLIRASLKRGRAPRHENAYRPHPMLTGDGSCRRISLRCLKSVICPRCASPSRAGFGLSVCSSGEGRIAGYSRVRGPATRSR